MRIEIAFFLGGTARTAWDQSMSSGAASGSLPTAAAISSSVPLPTLPRSRERVGRGGQSVRLRARLVSAACVLDCFSFIALLARTFRCLFVSFRFQIFVDVSIFSCNTYCANYLFKLTNDYIYLCIYKHARSQGFDLR